jgi:hypothetical protein
MKEFYHNNDYSRVSFHLDIFTKQDGTYNIVSNIPKELILARIEELEDSLDDNCKYKGSKSDFVKELGNRILEHQQSKFFFYPDYLFKGGMMFTETWEEILKLGKGFPVKAGDYYSETSENVKFYILSLQIHRCRLYYPDDYKKEFVEIGRAQFESKINCERVAADYIHNHSQSNRFLFVKESGFSLYILTNDEHPKLIIVTK